MAPLDALASGIHSAFLVGAGLALVAVAASFLVRRPKHTMVDVPVH